MLLNAQQMHMLFMTLNLITLALSFQNTAMEGLLLSRVHHLYVADRMHSSYCTCTLPVILFLYLKIL